MLGLIEGLLKVLAVIIGKPRVLIVIFLVLPIVGGFVYGWYVIQEIRHKQTELESSNIQKEGNKEIKQRKLVRELFNLLEKCNNKAMGENCFLSFYEVAYILDEETGYILKLMMLTRGKINEYTNKYEESELFDYTVSNSRHDEPYIIPNWFKHKIIENNRCSFFEVATLPRDHPFMGLLARQSIKIERGAYCLGGCTITLTQRIGHTTKCNTPNCNTELANLYYKYFDENKCSLDIQLVAS
tara:strand:- start:630 stop:1355 length:726 start_codon:yes stop_codon:yes gene_type:complete